MKVRNSVKVFAEFLLCYETFGLPGSEREKERKPLVELDEMITDKVIKN